MRIADPEGANPPLFGMSALCRTRRVEGACSQQAWPPSSFLGSFLAKRPRKQLVMVGNPGPRHGKHIAFICHFHHPRTNLSKKNGKSSWMHSYFVPSSWHCAQKNTQKFNRAVALSHEALSGTSRSHCLTLPPRHRLSSSTQLSSHHFFICILLFLLASGKTSSSHHASILCFWAENKKQRQKHNR